MVPVLIAGAFASGAEAGRNLVSGCLAVKYRNAVPAPAGARATELAGLGFTVIPVTPAGEERTAAALASAPEVGAATPVYRYPAALLPNDPFFGLQWHHVTIGSPTAWDLTRGSSGVTVAILDTGVDATHPDLHGRVLAGFNFADENTDTTDAEGHGTMVAGTAAATGNNAVGVAGLGWSNPILPVRIADADGLARSDTIASAIHWAADRGARVINISFGPLQGDALISAAARYARSKGTLVFAAAGNEGVRTPEAADPSILFVSATDRTDRLASFSTFGPSVSLAAPGVEIATTGRYSQYMSASGTSFASPLAAGTAALVWSVNGALTADQVESILRRTAHDLGAAGADELYGSGRIDTGAAVRAAAATLPAPFAPIPTPTPVPAAPVTQAPARPTPAPSPTPAPTVTLALTSPGPNGLWMGNSLLITWKSNPPGALIAVTATLDGSIRAAAPNTAGGPATTFAMPAFSTLTRGNHVLQVIGVPTHGGEVRSSVTPILRY